MAQIDRFMIAPLTGGLHTDLRPWLIPDDAFAQLNNAYVFRGRVRKRFGSIFMNQSVDPSLQQLYSRLRIKVDTTSASGDQTGTVPGIIYEIGQMFSIGPSFYTVVTAGTDQPMLFTPGTIGETNILGDATGIVPGAGGSIGMSFEIGGFTYDVTASSGALTPVGLAPGSGTFDTSTGAYTFTGVESIADIYFITMASGTYDTTNGDFVFSSAYFGTDIYFYPAQPVTGFSTYDEDQPDNEPVFAYDTQFAYFFDSSAWQRLGTATWTGADWQLFWSASYRGLTSSDYYLFVTNNNEPDLIKYWNGTQWNNLNPVINQTTRLVTALMIAPFKDRLVTLNPVVATYGTGTSVGTTNGSTGNLSATVPLFVSNVPNPTDTNAFQMGDNILVGIALYTVNSNTAGAQPMLANYSVTFQNGTPPTATFDVSTGALVITGNGNNRGLPVYYLSSGPFLLGSSVRYDSRAIFSQNGTPVGPTANPNATNAWLTDIPGLGGFIEATTKEAITSSEYIKDRLIVYFEQSTWELVYTFNQVLPYVWQKINTELGAISTFSTVPFDKVVIGIGDVGIHACNGSNVERIDDNIPDTVFDFSKENEGIERVFGIRDYYSEMIYWAFQSQNVDNIYPNKVLVYNYKNQCWAINDDSITAFGAFYTDVDSTWASVTQQWQELESTWASGVFQIQFRNVVAGNQQGYIFLIQRDVTSNSPALQITDISISSNQVTVTSINHNLVEGDYVMIENAAGVSNLNLNIYLVQMIVDANNFIVYQDNPFASGTYEGAGTLRRISQINILTKQFNFYVKDGRNSMINKVDFQVDRTAYGAITVDYFISSAEESTLTAGGSTGTQTIMGNGVLETSAYPGNTYEAIQKRLWHPIYPVADGEFIQLNIYLSDAQMRNIDTAWAAFELHAFTFYTTPTSSRLQ